MFDALGRLCRGSHGEEVLALLRRHAPMWLVQLPALLNAADWEILQRRTQHATRARMLRELAEALEVVASERPLILVLEDLHWSDASTLDLLTFLARRKDPARLFVIGAYRPVEMLKDEHPLKSITQELYGHQAAKELALGVLSAADIEMYVTKQFGGGAQRDASLQKLHRILHYRTGGNPLFLVSLVNDLVAHGALKRTEEGWMFQDESDTGGIPDTIRQLVARQRERLHPKTQRLLEAASAAKLEFSAASVAAALGLETPVVEQQCERLAEQHQFLRRAGLVEWPDGTVAACYSFLHALYQQLWHERVSPAQLQHYHLQIGERKEQAYGARAREIAAELSMHFEQGRDYRKAIEYLQQAAENAIRRSANQEAIGLFKKGLELLKTLPDTPERAKQELTLQVALGAVGKPPKVRKPQDLDNRSEQIS